jgi:hypothetical protein
MAYTNPALQLAFGKPQTIYYGYGKQTKGTPDEVSLLEAIADVYLRSAKRAKLAVYLKQGLTPLEARKKVRSEF